MGCAAADPWPGRYQGTSVSEARDCDTGEPYDNAQEITVTVERGTDGGLFVNGRCLIELEELSAMSARVDPTACDVASDDGTPLRVRVIEGRAGLVGDRLALEYSAETVGPGVCLTALVTFEGDRL
jgi:hypothetical protein